MTPDPAGLAQGVQRCSVPGCTGTIEDGYCNVCGPPAGAAPVASVPSQAGRGAGGVPADPSRTGAVGGAVGASGNGTVAGTDGAVSTRSSLTSSSNRLASTPLGSMRVGGSPTTRQLGTSSTRLRGAPPGARPATIPSVPPPHPPPAITGKP